MMEVVGEGLQNQQKWRSGRVGSWDVESWREDRCSNKTEEDSLGNSTLVSRAEIPTPEQMGKWEESRHSSNNQKGVLAARQVWRIG